MHPVKAAFIATVQDKLSRTTRYLWEMSKYCHGRELITTADKLEMLSKKLQELSDEVRSMNTSIILLEEEMEKERLEKVSS